MEQQQTNGYKKTKIIPLRIDTVQHKRLEALASAEGFTTISSYIRSKIFEPSVESKLNSIINLLKEKNK